NGSVQTMHAPRPCTKHAKNLEAAMCTQDRRSPLIEFGGIVRYGHLCGQGQIPPVAIGNQPRESRLFRVIDMQLSEIWHTGRQQGQGLVFPTFVDGKGQSPDTTVLAEDRKSTRLNSSHV